jgi:membrane-associated phospholipid phosphatase
MASSDEQALAQMRYWNAGAPPYRWIGMVNQRLRDGRLGVSITSFRAYDLLGVAMYDATIAAWDSKFTWNRARPAETDPSIRPRITTPRSPSYPSEHAVVAGAAATVLGYLFPAEAEAFQHLAEEAGRSRLTAGVHYPSDVIDGLELGRAVGRKIVADARLDRTDTVWTGTIPSGNGYWVGANPGFAAAGLWRPRFLDRADEFRPSPPPAYDSPERAAELAELRAMRDARNFNTNANATFWQTAEGVHTWFFDYVSQKLFETGLDENAPRAARAYALLGMVQYDAHIASNDGKFYYWTIRPSQQDSTLTTVFPSPNFPSYPSNHSCHSAARTALLAYLFPDDAEYVLARGEEAGISRLWAGIHFRSDHDAGVRMGRVIAQKLIGIAQQDGSQQ